MKTVVQQIIEYLKKYDIEPNSDHIEMFEEIFKQQIVDAYVFGLNSLDEKTPENVLSESYYTSTFESTNKETLK